MNGAPAKPISGTSPSAEVSWVIAVATGATCSGSSGAIARTSSRVRIGWSITGPTSGTMSSAIPAARSGTTMSENRIAASTPCLRTGCSVISVIRSASKQACIIVFLARSARYSGSDRTGLPHHPHRHPVGFAAGDSGQVGRFGQLAARIHRLPCCHARPLPNRRACAQTWPYGLASDVVTTAEPAQFREAVAAMNATTVRPEIELGPIRPPQRLAPFSYALGAEVKHAETAIIPERSEGDAFGRLILLHDPEGAEAWDGTMRLVAYIQADLDSSEAVDPLLPEVAWSWLVDALEERAEHVTALGGTVTATTSVRYGDISGPPRAHQLELRASWTATTLELGPHVEAFCEVLEHAAGLPPDGVTDLNSRYPRLTACPNPKWSVPPWNLR